MPGAYADVEVYDVVGVVPADGGPSLPVVADGVVEGAPALDVEGPVVEAAVGEAPL